MTSLETGATAPAHLWRDEIRAMLWLAWPMVLTNLAQMAMATTDIIFLGRLGPDALAASALGANIYYAPMLFGMGLVLSSQPIMATALGRKLHTVHYLRRTVRQGFWLAILIAIPIWALLWNGGAILAVMGQEPALAETGGTYLRWLQWGLLPFYFYIVLRSFISVLERPGWALAVAFAAVAANAFGNWLLVSGNLGFPKMGVAGAGLATTLSNCLMFGGLALVVMSDRQFRRYRLFGRFWRSDWPRFRAMLKLGLPISGILVFETSVFNAAAFAMGFIGAPALAAHAIALQIANITFMVPLGLGQAATVRVGLAFGAGDREGVRRAGWTAYMLGIGFMAVTGILILVAPRLLIGVYIDIDDPVNATVIGLAANFLMFAALFQIVDGVQAVGAGTLRGLHDTTIPMIFAAIGYWAVGLPLGLFLAFRAGLQGSGIWMGLSAGLAVVALLLIARWLRRDRIVDYNRPRATPLLMSH